MTTLSKIVLSTMAACLLGSAANAEEGVKLRYKLAKGQKQIYRTTTSIKQTQKVGERKMDFTMSNATVVVRTLKEVDKKGNLHVDVETKSLKATLGGVLGDYKYDSTKKENDEASEIGAALTPVYDTLNGSSITVVVSPRGEVQDVKGYTELLKDVLKDNPLGERFVGGSSKEMAKLQAGEFYPVLSKNPVRPGDFWDSPFELTIPKLGKFTGKNNYTFDGPGKLGKKKTLKISVTTELSADLKLSMGEAKVTGNLSIGNSSGTIHFDPETGQILKSTATYTMTGTLNITAGDNQFTVDMEQKQTAGIERLDKLPK